MITLLEAKSGFRISLITHGKEAWNPPRHGIPPKEILLTTASREQEPKSYLLRHLLRAQYGLQQALTASPDPDGHLLSK
ncbi:MAG: hypothetical protein NQ127_04570 [Candidatus Cardinium sp.]|nr:hypothetical protein [Candidatus Cardinium sp.]